MLPAQHIHLLTVAKDLTGALVLTGSEEAKQRERRADDDADVRQPVALSRFEEVLVDITGRVTANSDGVERSRRDDCV